MEKQLLLFYLLGLLFFQADAQQISYTAANAHSHNDYENKFPFVTAYNEKFGSIETDIFLWNDSLIVAHTLNDLQYKRTLETLYLEPLQKKTLENNGHPYKDSALSLQLLIDIKTGATATLGKLVRILYNYPGLINSKKIFFIITGNRPLESAFHDYPSFILFDGDISKNYTEEALKKIKLLSGNFKNYTQWDGNDIIPGADKAVLNSLIGKAHHAGKKIRFWNSPDFINAWRQLVCAGVDYINTDHIPELSAFLNQLQMAKSR